MKRAVLYVWCMFISWHVVTRSMVSIAQEASSKQLGSVEWFYITILVTCVTVLFGLSTWLLGKTLARINADIEQRRIETDRVRKETSDQIHNLTQSVGEIARCVAKLKGEHDAFVSRGIHS